MDIKYIIKRLFIKNYVEDFWRKYFYCRKHKNFLQIKYRFDLRRLQQKYNCFIPINADIDERIIFPHEMYGIFISQGAKIGKNCVMFHQTTIGSNNIKDSKNIGTPVIGDNCYIGAGAKVIGNVKIGNNVRIGANCCVSTDIPDNATVVCGDNRIIIHDKPRDNSFYPFEKKFD